MPLPALLPRETSDRPALVSHFGEGLGMYRFQKSFQDQSHNLSSCRGTTLGAWRNGKDGEGRKVPSYLLSLESWGQKICLWSINNNLRKQKSVSSAFSGGRWCASWLGKLLFAMQGRAYSYSTGASQGRQEKMRRVSFLNSMTDIICHISQNPKIWCDWCTILQGKKSALRCHWL